MRVALVALLVIGCSKGKPAPVVENQRAAPADAAVTTEADCDQLLSHLVDLEYATTPDVAADIAKQKASVTAAKRDEFQTSCLATPRERVLCAAAAPSLEAVAKCDEH
jgi:hypothetical protein